MAIFLTLFCIVVVITVGAILPISVIAPMLMLVVFPIVMMMFILVVRVIMFFKIWYVGEKRFELVLLAFSLLIAVYFITCSIGFVIGWEGIGLISFLLIGYWGRSPSLSASVAAVIYNRFGDLVLILILLNISNPIWFFVAILAKSATWLSSYWLPIAIEGPTPVSSLLHSSTMVVAGLYIASLWSIPVFFVVLNASGIIMLSLNGSLNDVKNIIAYSTAVNLAVIMQFMAIQLWSIVLLHIIVHAFINASVFIWSSSLIHSISSQGVDVIISLYILFGFVLLIGIPGIFVGLSKEIFVSEIIAISSLLVWLVANYVKKLVHSMIIIEIFCVFLLPVVLLMVGSGNVVIIDQSLLILWMLMVSHFVVITLQR